MSYRNSGMLKENWKKKRIEQCFKIKSGDFLPANKMAKEGNIDVYGGNGITGKHDLHNLTGENIIIGRVGAKCGNVKRVNRNIWVTDNAFYISELIEEFDLRFLEYLLNQINLRNTANQTAQPVISYTTIKHVVLVIPPLAEQKRIVAILDEAFEGCDRAIRNTEKNLANARELFKSYLNDIFTQKGDGWEDKRLGEVCTVKDGTHFSPKNSEDGKYMYITAKNIKPYYIDLTKLTFISEEDHQQIYSRCPVKKGDVLYIKDGATAGIAAINNFEEEFSLLSSVAVFKTSPQILNTYLVHYANSYLGRKNFLGYIDGAAITRLTLTKLNSVLIPVPPFFIQQEIVTKLDALSSETKRLEAIYRRLPYSKDEP